MRVVRLSCEDDFESWRISARALASARVPASDIVWQVGDAPSELFADEQVELRSAGPFSLPRSFVEMAGRVILHRDPERFSLLYAMLRRVLDSPRILQDRADPGMRRIDKMDHSVRRDMHKMRAFVRFREIEEDDGPRFIAWFEPDHHIVRANASFFVGRFATMRWSILTPDVSIHWDGRTLTEGPGASKADAPSDDPVEHVWKTYYRSIFNPARLMTNAMLKEMPKRYWKNMPETALVPDLIAGARAREISMISQARPTSRRDEPASLEALRGEAAGCRRCPLWTSATQTVFGEGPADADIMIVGEQPGDQEDLAGRPFTGPAGGVLDRALKAAGIDRTSVYVTNAVKHFKFEPRGKRRIHAKPNVAEINACQWWLDEERAIIRPKLIIAMGATAARAVLGRPVKVGSVQTEPTFLDGGVACWITVHPSYILRLVDATDSEKAYARLVTDLAAAHAFLSEGQTGSTDHGP